MTRVSTKSETQIPKSFEQFVSEISPFFFVCAHCAYLLNPTVKPIPVFGPQEAPFVGVAPALKAWSGDADPELVQLILD